jgi:uncharacterized protein (DUF433 family)
MSAQRLKRQRHTTQIPLSLRLTAELDTAIRRRAEITGRTLANVVRDLLERALRSERFPGVVFVEGPYVRRAHLADAGIDVWKVVALLQEGRSPAALLRRFPRLSERSLRAAQAYARVYPHEIRLLLELEQLMEEGTLPRRANPR